MSQIKSNTESLQILLEAITNLPGYQDVGTALSEHNTATDSHNDIRKLIDDLTALVEVLSAKASSRIFFDQNEPEEWTANDLWCRIEAL